MSGLKRKTPAGSDRRGSRESVNKTDLIRARRYGQAERQLRRRYLAQRIHALGARVLLELVEELDRHHELGADLDRRLERYASLDPALLRALGADHFAPEPIRIVGCAR
jgi:hypothetical protein